MLWSLNWSPADTDRRKLSRIHCVRHSDAYKCVYIYSAVFIFLGKTNSSTRVAHEVNDILKTRSHLYLMPLTVTPRLCSTGLPCDVFCLVLCYGQKIWAPAPVSLIKLLVWLQNSTWEQHTRVRAAKEAVPGPGQVEICLCYRINVLPCQGGLKWGDITVYSLDMRLMVFLPFCILSVIVLSVTGPMY